MAVRVEAAYSLPNKSSGWEDIQLMGGICGAYPCHVRIDPGEHVSVSLQYFLQLGPFLFGQEGTYIGTSVRAAYEHGL